MVAGNGQASRRGSACLTSLPACRAKSQTPTGSGRLLFPLVDYYSRWIEAILLKKTDDHHVVRSMEAIFRTHGLSECVRSDNGPPFASEQFETFLEYLGIQHKKSVPYWPQSNGEVERCIETLLKIVRIAQLGRRD